MRVRMKNLMGVMEGGSIPALSNLEEAMKAEQKVLIYLSYLHVPSCRCFTSDSYANFSLALEETNK